MRIVKLLVEELVAGSKINIGCISSRVKKNISLTLMVENRLAKINPKDWNMTPGRHCLELWADPQNNTNAHAELQDNNRIIVAFAIK
jgi:hypothetical protein